MKTFRLNNNYKITGKKKQAKKKDEKAGFMPLNFLKRTGDTDSPDPIPDEDGRIPSPCAKVNRGPQDQPEPIPDPYDDGKDEPAPGGSGDEPEPI